MLTDKTIEAVKNTRSLKHFILLDDLDLRYRVINPMGEILIIPANLFDPDVAAVTADGFGEFFTPEQLAAYRKHLERLAAEAEREQRQRALAPPPPRTIVAPAAQAPKSRGTPRSKEKVGLRRGMAAAWSSDRLTFFRNRIEPLDPKQTFKVTVAGHGEFEISKEEFVKNFNDVAMSVSYRQEGFFAYNEVPGKAVKYKK